MAVEVVEPMKVGVLVSGNGTNLQALLDSPLTSHLISVVISNRPDVPALTRAAKAGVPAIVIDHKAYASRELFEDAVHAVLVEHGAEVIVLAGFMRVLTASFVARYPLKIVNTHPSLLPAFPGTDAPAQAIAYGVKLAGVTIHFVDATLDGGPIIKQLAVPVFPDDDAHKLHQRIQEVEHKLLPVVVSQLAAGQLSCEGRIVRAE
jgi:phosphoribosylglycinamide formyltransferase-1